jgi:UDP-N-acetylglucosamine--N-acetylmuramyl-(pentapeptide) pyrophosphoryl-undecaprenol N-acetylglucosamine transferase
VVTFAGSPDRVEARLVPEQGYEFDAFTISGLPRRAHPDLLRALGRAVAAPSACRAILRRRKPHAVLGAGGYVAGPMVLAARLERIPSALTEADAHLGLANRLAAPLADRVFLALPVGRAGAKYRAVGRPIPAASRPLERDAARSRLGLSPDARVVLVFGGSLGARLLNDLALDAWAESGPAVIHLCGERDYPELRGRVSRPDYILRPFMEGIGVAYGAADVVLARAGGSVWELAAAGLPVVLVPGAFATGAHQEKNARWFAEAGGAVVVPEAEAERAPGVVEELLGDTERLGAMAAAMRAVAKPDAAEEIADELVSLAAARR